LSFQEHVHGGESDVQNPLQDAPFQVIETGPLVHGTPDKAGEILGQSHERFVLANLESRCDDHSTASMRVVCESKHESKAAFC